MRTFLLRNLKAIVLHEFGFCSRAEGEKQLDRWIAGLETAMKVRSVFNILVSSELDGRNMAPNPEIQSPNF
jgi:hypothetical protein